MVWSRTNLHYSSIYESKFQTKLSLSNRVERFFFKGFITCAVGIKYVGLVMIVYGVCDALSSFAFGQIAKYVRRLYCLMFAALINYSLIITMMIWVPNENQLWVLFVLAGLWGVADGCWQTQSSLNIEFHLDQFFT